MTMPLPIAAMARKVSAALERGDLELAVRYSVDLNRLADDLGWEMPQATDSPAIRNVLVPLLGEEEFDVLVDRLKANGRMA